MKPSLKTSTKILLEKEQYRNVVCKVSAMTFHILGKIPVEFAGKLVNFRTTRDFWLVRGDGRPTFH